jgi:hypothetical protein
VRIHVVRSRVREIRFLKRYGRHSSGSTISASRLRKLAAIPLTVEEAFAQVKECIAKDHPLLWVVFDEELGAPLHWTCGELETDGWWGASIRNLDVDTPPKPSLQRPGEP